MNRTSNSSSSKRVLIVDDEPDLRELLEITVRGMDLDAATAADLGEARALLADHHFGLCLTDMRLPDGDGLSLVSHIQAEHPTVPVAVITAHGSVEAAVLALKKGAFDFLTKPLDLGNLRNIISTALHLDGGANTAGDSLLGRSEAMDRVRDVITRVARSQAPVHIRGESGTGKELVARMIHEASGRREKTVCACQLWCDSA